MLTFEELALETQAETRVVEIGGVAVALRTSSLPFARMIEERYAGFVTTGVATSQEAWTHSILLDVELFERAPKQFGDAEVEQEADLKNDDLQDDDLDVTFRDGLWRMQRGDFSARWDPATGRGKIRQAANPHSLDSVLRIVHSLVLAAQGEFLVHAASAIRNGRAFLFAGVSGAGKTTISRLAPADATVLTDEISYVRKSPTGYDAHGTPFAGELARVGAHCAAPLRTLYLLRQGPENKIEEVPPVQAAQALMRNILFFAHDAELVQSVFEGACDFVDRVAVRRLTFRPEAAVWDLIG